MRILIATDNRFWRRALGSHQRIYQLLRFLHSQGHELEVMFVGAPTKDDVLAMRELDFVRIEATQAIMVEGTYVATNYSSPLKRIVRECLHRLRRMPTDFAHRLRTGQRSAPARFALSMQEPKLRDFVRPAAIAMLNRRLAEYTPDALFIEYLRLSYLVDAIPKAFRVRLKVLLDTHDVLFERRQRFHQAGLAHDVDITPAEEAAAMVKYDTIIAIQSYDAEKIRALVPQCNVIVAGHAGLSAEIKRPELTEPRFLFLGSDMKPNLDAARRLAFDIWPEVNRRLCGKASLSIVGKVCSALTGEVLAPNIELKGHVPSLNETYCMHDIFLNPVSFGGGLKIKNVEALVHGLALVTSSIGAEGLERGAGSAFLIADDDEQFVQAACRVATDRALRTSLSETARAFADQHLGADSAYGELLKYLNHGTTTARRTNRANQSINVGVNCERDE